MKYEAMVKREDLQKARSPSSLWAGKLEEAYNTGGRDSETYFRVLSVSSLSLEAILIFTWTSSISVHLLISLYLYPTRS